MSLLRRTPIRRAIVANCAAQGNMSIVMVLTSLVLHHHGHSLSAIAFSHMFHTVGMFGFTIPLGRLADRMGREQVMYPGVAVALVGAALVTFTPAFWSVTLGTFLVGIGWAAANVASTALIADRSETGERGRAIGVSDIARRRRFGRDRARYRPLVMGRLAGRRRGGRRVRGGAAGDVRRSAGFAQKRVAPCRCRAFASDQTEPPWT